MTQNSNKTETEQEKSTKRWSRKEKAEKQAKLEKAAEQGISQRAATKQNGVPRSTARAWEKKETEISNTPGVNPEVVKFLASPAGTEFVHRLVISVVFVFTLNNPAGLDKVCEFLSLSNLDKVVGSSHGSIQKLSVEIHKLLAEFSQEQVLEKKATMEQKEITLCLDETFFRRLLCLVAIEPVSNFILLEKDVEDRKADTWLKNIEEAIGELPINVIQITSDEAKALLCLAKDLEIPHSPDLFHVLQPLIRAMSLRMAKLVKTAMEAYQKAVEKTQKLIVNQDEAANKKRGSGRTSIFQRCLAEAESEEDKAKKALETAQANQRKMSAAIAGISEDYHPYSLKTGQKQSAEQVETLLYKRFSTIENIAEKVQLPEACFKAIKKSKKLVPSMVESIRFFHMKIVESISTLSLNMGQIYHVLTCLIPALYLSRVANRATLADDRKDLMEMAQNILKSRGDDHPLK
ncbi:MAG: hypothetical protein H8D23_39050, partial [Candidatus Brocadiales bacterium]|nr:hypothetical protein [Candidatus Brocadiales bacterium]